jgi:hypothetical protein
MSYFSNPTTSSYFERAKGFAGTIASTAAEWKYPPSTMFLAKYSIREDLKVPEFVLPRFQNLPEQDKNSVYGKIWELAKKDDPRIEGEDWGKDHASENTERLANAMQRLGFFKAEDRANIHEFNCLPFAFGEGGLGSQYFSLGEKLGKDPMTGHVGYVHGMGVPSLEHAGHDAALFSDRFVDGNNLHCTYHATHQKTRHGDAWGFVADVARMKAVDGGSYTKTSYLIAQQCIDFLNANPGRNYLQIGHSEGAAHVNAALRLIKESRPDLLSRLRVITFCPAHFILPETYSDGLQVINLVKREDHVINPFAAGTDKIGRSNHIVVVPHTTGNPHDHLTDDYINAGKKYIDRFMYDGYIY